MKSIIKDRDIDNLALTQATLNILYDHDIYTVRLLTKTKMSELLWMRGISRIRVKDIVKALAQHNLTLSYEKPFNKKSSIFY